MATRKKAKVTRRSAVSRATPIYDVRLYKGDYLRRQRQANADKCVAYVEHHFNSSESPAASYAVALTGANASQTSRNRGAGTRRPWRASSACRSGASRASWSAATTAAATTIGASPTCRRSCSNRCSPAIPGMPGSSAATRARHGWRPFCATVSSGSSRMAGGSASASATSTRPAVRTIVARPWPAAAGGRFCRGGAAEGQGAAGAHQCARGGTRRARGPGRKGVVAVHGGCGRRSALGPGARGAADSVMRSRHHACADASRSCRPAHQRGGDRMN